MDGTLELQFTKHPYDLKKTSVVAFVHAVAFGGIIAWCFGWLNVSWQTNVFTFVWFNLSSLSITAGYHRLFAHPTYKASRWLEVGYVFFGAVAFQSSVFDWARLHRDHHAHTDRQGDPYNIKIGIWHAHIGWVLRQTFPDPNMTKSLNDDRLLQWQHKFIVPLQIVMCFALPSAIGAMWGQAFETLIVAGFIRLMIQWHMTFCANSLAHCVGDREWTTEVTARSNWFVALITYGEGMSHNWHHYVNSRDYRAGIRWYDPDPAKWCIWTCDKIGLASGLRRYTPKRGKLPKVVKKPETREAQRRRKLLSRTFVNKGR